MKLLLTVINHDDAHDVMFNLTQSGYNVTKLATTGGFLMVGNVTFIVGVEDERLEGALDIIRRSSTSRGQMMPKKTEAQPGSGSELPINITVGGATVFVLNVDQFYKF